MPRIISTSLRKLMQQQESGEAIIPFLTITHPTIDPPIRVAGDGVDYVWQGEDWTGFFYEVNMLSDDESPPKTQLSIQNVDRRIGDTLLSISTPARIRLDLVAASEFDQTANPRTPLGTPPIEYTANFLFLTGVTVDAGNVTGDVVSWDYTQDTWPGRRATQDRFPALYR